MPPGAKEGVNHLTLPFVVKDTGGRETINDNNGLLIMETPQTPKLNGKHNSCNFLAAAANSKPQSFEKSDRTFAERVVFLIGPDQIPRIMVDAMVKQFGPATVIEEEKEPTSTMVKRRARMLGWIEALGQVAFGLWLKLLHKLSARRKQEIFSDAGLVAELPATSEHYSVPSVNSDACRAKLKELNPDLIVVIGTRMIKSKTLRATKAKVINYHAGINPTYRGMNGGYFAMANGEPDKFGLTVHLVDEGVDTGEILVQTKTTPSRSDNFTTYPLVLAVAGRDALAQAITQVLDGKIKPIQVTLPSKQWFHPTLWSYLWTGLTKGVW